MGFDEEFQAKYEDLSKNIDTVKSEADKSKCRQELDGLTELCRKNKKHLTQHDLKVCMETLAQLDDKLSRTMKHSFAFRKPIKKKSALPEATKSADYSSKDDSPVIDTDSENIRLANLASQQLHLCDTKKSAKIDNIADCTINLKVDGPVYISNARNCTVTTQCHQLRIHKSSNITIHCGTARPIIEECSAIEFIQIPDATKIEGVDDFNWLQGGQSKNWVLSSPS